MMKIFGKRFTRRGASVVIAALLLIAIAVAAAVLLYVFSIGLMGSLQGGGGQQVKQQLILEAYNWIPASGGVTATVRNVGTASITVADAFIGGLTAGMGPGAGTTGCAAGPTTGTYSVPLQVSCTLLLTPDSTLTITPGVAYTLKLVTADGGVFSYSAIAGQAS